MASARGPPHRENDADLPEVADVAIAMIEPLPADEFDQRVSATALQNLPPGPGLPVNTRPRQHSPRGTDARLGVTEAAPATTHLGYPKRASLPRVDRPPLRRDRTR
jgi:hypothetical protein